MKRLMVMAAVMGIAILNGCGKASGPATMVKGYPIKDLDGVITQTGVVLDKQISSDGNGSLRITADQSTTVRLYETGDLDVENARLTFQAKVRTSDFTGKAYLEMWCHFAGKGEFFSRDLQTPVTGTADWSTEEALFFLKSGENPDNVKLNLVIEGKGTVWIDDIRVLIGSSEKHREI